MKSKPRILYLAPCWPAGKPFGLRLRTAAVASALRSVGEVDCVVVQVGGDDQTADKEGSSAYGVKHCVVPERVGNRSLVSRLRCGLDSRYVGYQGYMASAEDRKFLSGMLSQYDLVWIHHLHTANYLARWRWPDSLVDLDDIPSTYVQSVMQQASTLGQRFRLKLRMEIARRRERQLPNRFSALAVCSDADRDYLGLHAKVHVIPNGFARPASEPVYQPSTPARIGFIGKFGYVPNDEGIRWFIRECWPGIQREIPGARLRIIGLGGEEFTRLGNDIDALGWVGDPRSEIATWSTMIVPLLMGSGTRLKIAEGFSRKCPVISTSLGAYGYDVASGRELLLADCAKDFAAACVKIARQPEAAKVMAERAWKIFNERWTWEAIQPRICAAAEDCLRQNAKSAGAINSIAA